MGYISWEQFLRNQEKLKGNLSRPTTAGLRGTGAHCSADWFCVEAAVGDKRSACYKEKGMEEQAQGDRAAAVKAEQVYDAGRQAKQ